MCCVQGAEASEPHGSVEIRKLHVELETSRAKADGHQHALQELSVQAQACSRPNAFHRSAEGVGLITPVCCVFVRGYVNLQ